MIERHYDRQQPYRVAIYARMSSDAQTERSPEQQIDTIKQVIQRHNCPWTVVKICMDRGMSGRYIARREGLQSMLANIASGCLKVDLIVVDTAERFGRSDEITEIVRKLRNDYGVFVVAANRDFADPTGLIGQALGMVEQMRATEEGRVKAHQVIRGKKDALRQKHWPGGTRPFGYTLETIVDRSGSRPRMYSVPQIHPQEGPVRRRILLKAYETGWGATRLAKYFNADPAIPQEYKPFYSSTIDWWLDDELNIGNYSWGRTCCDIVDDARVVEPNPHPEEIARVEGICAPLISVEIFNALRAMQAARRAAHRGGRHQDEARPEKLIQPIAPGVTLRYSLSGLACCGACGASLRPVPSGRTSKAGTCYTYYVCPRYITGACANSYYQHEGKFRRAVMEVLQRRVFATTPGTVPEWFAPLAQRLRQILEQRRADHPTRQADDQAQIRQLDQQIAGWTMSLGDPQLDAGLRADLTRLASSALRQRQDLEARVAEDEALHRHVESMLDEGRVVARLECLRQVLDAHTPTLVNLDLARFMHRIDCHPDGRVVVTATMLGLVDGAVDLFGPPVAGPNAASNPPDGAYPAVRPRRRTRRQVDTLSADCPVTAEDVIRLLDPNRFAGVPEEFMWHETLQIAPTLCWAEEHAQAVGKLYQQDPVKWSIIKLSQHFGVTPPTLRKALRIALDKPTGPVVPNRRYGRKRIENSSEIVDRAADLYQQGVPIMKIAAELQVSHPAVAKALDQWYARQGMQRPDGRACRGQRQLPPPGGG